MSIELKIPDVGESIREVQIGRWLKQEGDSVEQDENVVELETDKASMELPAPAAGVLSKILKQQGDMVAVGEVIGTWKKTARHRVRNVNRMHPQRKQPTSKSVLKTNRLPRRQPRRKPSKR